MKFQLFAIGLTAASTFGALSLAAPAQAVQEREFNSSRTPQSIGRVSSVAVKVSGQITSNTDEDVFRFEISPGQDVKAVLTVDGDIDLEVLQDSNQDGQLGGGDTKKISIREGKFTEEVNFKNMKSKHGFIRIMDSGGAGVSRSVNYNLTVTAVPANGQPVIE
ncbi:hypothetical protein H6F89_23130 [Cyanobacteria bacterium FACHB-63]|nr:hypothetical protein [Cyanobacteria bacterium FACHB-63]